MTTFIIAALTADGFIAKNSSHMPLEWTSKEDKKFFSERTKKAEVVVLGLNTYKTIGRPLPDRLNIVYSDSTQNIPGVEITQKSPVELLRELSSRGYEEAAIIGGSQIYTIFMEAGVVDKLYLTIESVVFGLGMNIFTRELDIKLKLESTVRMGEETVLLEYNVVK